MKGKIITTLGIGLLSLPVFAATSTTTTSQSTVAPSTVTETTTQTTTQAGQLSQTDKLSYIIGLQMGKNFKNQDITINNQYLLKGLSDAVSGTKPLFSEDEMRQALLDFQKQLIAKRQAKNQVLGDKNLQESKAFLEKNKMNPGIQTLPNGLQYKIIKPGSGNSPTADDTVTVNYEGTLPNGEVFDSSYKRGKPATFPVSGVIKGWQEALKMMKPGSEWQIFIPADLAYGQRGAGQQIGPNQALIFKVELISVDKNQKTAQQPQKNLNQ